MHMYTHTHTHTHTHTYTHTLIHHLRVVCVHYLCAKTGCVIHLCVLCMCVCVRVCVGMGEGYWLHNVYTYSPVHKVFHATIPSTPAYVHTHIPINQYIKPLPMHAHVHTHIHAHVHVYTHILIQQYITFPLSLHTCTHTSHHQYKHVNPLPWLWLHLAPPPKG